MIFSFSKHKIIISIITYIIILCFISENVVWAQGTPVSSVKFSVNDQKVINNLISEKIRLIEDLNIPAGLS